MGKNCRNGLTDAEVLEALREHRYEVISEEGIILGRGYKMLRHYPGRNGHRYVRIYYKNRCKSTNRSRVVWMACTGAVIPAGFEIHHMDGNNTNDAWDNLLCVHKDDHKKIHAQIAAVVGEYEDSVPF